VSRKHYVEAARIVREAAYLSEEARTRLVSDLVVFFSDDNPRFSPSRFREACKPADARTALDRARAAWARTSDQLELVNP
jgi:hypothetical protein